MNIVEIRLGVAHTLNLGNFESLRVEAGLTISIKEGDDLAEIRTKAQEVLRNMCEESYRSQRRQKNGKPADPRVTPAEGSA